MNKLAKLNGWRRLWVVIVASTLIYAIGWSLAVGFKQHRVDYQVTEGFRNPRCAAVIQMPVRGKLNPEPTFNDPCWNLYLYRSIYEDAAQTEADYVQQMNSKQNAMLLQLTGFAVAAWLISMSLLYGAGVVVVWVIRGFRSGE